MILLFCVVLWLIIVSGNCQECQKTYERYLAYEIKPQRSKAELSRTSYEPPPATDIVPVCTSQCTSNSNCGGFVIDLTDPSKVTCILYDLSVPSAGENFIVNWIQPSNGKTTFRSICIQGAAKSCSNISSWFYENVPRWRLKSGMTTRLRHVQSMEQCMQHCALETDFICRSVSYSRLTRNCDLSRYDRRSAPSAFYQAQHEDIYIEYLCGTDIKSGCSFSEVTGLAMAYTLHIQRDVQTESDCITRCVQLQTFICRGYVWEGSGSRNCRITAEDTFAMETLDQTGTPLTYSQRGECIEAKVECTTNNLFAMFSFNREFRGKIYAIDAMDSCMFDIADQFQFQITLPLDKDSRDQCAIVEAPDNVFSTMMMLQYHDMVMTGMDRMFKLMCTFVALEQTVSESVELINPTVSPSPLVIEGGGKPPEAYLRIVNGQHQAVTTAELHQTLYSEIVLKPENGGVPEYGLFITNCEAFSDTSRMVLIDNFGCPTDTNVFEGFTIKPNTNNRVVRAAFRGFRFESQNKVNLNCNVNFCYKFCEPAFCTDKNGRRIQSYGRKKRFAQLPIIQQRFVAKETVHGEIFVGMTDRTFLTNITALQHTNSHDSLFLSRVPLGLVVGVSVVVLGSVASLTVILLWVWKKRSRKLVTE